MNRIRQKLIMMIQLASPPGIMGIDAILKAQEDARLTAELAAQRKSNRRDIDSECGSDMDSDNDHENGDGSGRGSSSSTQQQEGDEAEASVETAPTTRGYVPSPALIHHLIPGTQASPLGMSAYTQHIFEQALDEVGLKESILEALETIGALKDSGEDELPTLLDQQLTNLVLLWELEPYTETAPERALVEEKLGVVSWQMENVK
ncbi:hypothetical protein EDD11_004697 [Mortierella claussenii]|nr:hypothetical protein EDD11_004697 [Mortierella claussenii]